MRQVDLWVDPQSGLPLQVELYGADEKRPVLSTVLRELSVGTPSDGATRFAQAAGVRLDYEDSSGRRCRRQCLCSGRSSRFVGRPQLAYR